MSNFKHSFFRTLLYAQLLSGFSGVAIAAQISLSVKDRPMREQLMAEIGDVRRFLRRSSIVGFAGVDPAVNQSGKHSAKSVPTTKRGSPHLRKTLYQIVCTYLKKSPVDEPVYQFLDKKRSEGKPYFVYMTAAQNKFLRIYYAHAKECLETFDAQRDILTQCDPKGHLHLKLVINFVPIHLHHLQTFSLELLNPFADIIPYYPCCSQCFQWFPSFFCAVQ